MTDVETNLKELGMKPCLKIIKSLWQNNTIQIFFVVIDLSEGLEYPRNFVCVFPKNLFKRNQKGNLKRSRFFDVFGEKTYDTARYLLEDAFKREKDLKAKREIEKMLREIGESS